MRIHYKIFNIYIFELSKNLDSTISEYNFKFRISQDELTCHGDLLPYNNLGEIYCRRVIFQVENSRNPTQNVSRYYEVFF